MTFNRSEWLKERWKRAKAYKKWYDEVYPDKPKINVKKFLSNKNPLISSLREINVTYKLNYLKENKYRFYIPQDTIKLYAVGDFDETKLDIYIRDAIAKIFKGKSYLWIKNNLQIDFKDYRGIEYEDLGYNNVDLNKINQFNKVIVVDIPKKFKVIKKNKSSKANINEYDLTLDLFI